jgi:His/Glu/Gln/Arg/opine family amino acid ABC transporter permease subunit
MTIIDIAQEYWRPLLDGFWLTIQLAAATTAVGLVVGLFTAVGKVSRWRVARGLTTVYIAVFRGTPPLLQLFIVYFSLAQWGFVIPGFTCAVIALGLYAGSYTAEIFRAGIQAIPKGQIEAANSVAMTKAQVYRHVILPQAVRIIIPPMTNQLIFNLKATSLVVTIAIPDLMYVAYNGAAYTFRSAEFYTLAGILYLSVALLLGQVAKYAERHADPATRRRRRAAKIGEPLASGFGGPAT